MKEDNRTLGVDALLLDVNGPDPNNLGGRGPAAPPQAGFVGFPQPPMLTLQPPSGFLPFECPPNPSGGSAGGFAAPQAFNQCPSAPFSREIPWPYNIPPGADGLVSPGFDAASKPLNINNSQDVTPQPYSNIAPEGHPKIKQSDVIPKPAPLSKLNPCKWDVSQFPDLDGLPLVPVRFRNISEK
ncbi:hypothetical protein PR048_022056 [Dryococelus australis]|uniref:Uncharacterized protein n=1 Tax=Dryococelus australis TaxID=614101 RepID=A0ABQ9H012_9NEOP|nr:hypothetical protein PR048_022056 [Dryococelus australis]